jgi:hypothetical protein
VTALFWVSYFLQWVLLALVTLLVLLLYRQYGRTVLPAKDRLELAGLDIGTSVGEFPAGDGTGEPERILLSTGGDGAPVWRVLTFGSSACPVCARLWGEVGVLPAEQAGVEYWWIQAGEAKTDPPPAGWRLVSDAGGLSHDPMQVPAMPYAYALDSGGVVRSKGLMNGVDDFRALLAVAARNADGHQLKRVRA